jgi:hypothetical protein
MFHHIEHDERGVAEIGEALPGLGREQDGKPARMAEEFWRVVQLAHALFQGSVIKRQ